jgi:hypothetical protein
LTGINATLADGRLHHRRRAALRPEMPMRRLLALAACALMLTPEAPALAWGSLTSGGVWPAKFNTHGCLDRMAYAYLEKDPAFTGSAFPSLDAINAHEGINMSVEGPGPDAEGSTKYSYHYYNPHNDEGNAPTAVAENFLPLAYKQSGREKAAAWGAHFLADAAVPYHNNGEWASDLRAQTARTPNELHLSTKVTGDLALFFGAGNLTAVVQPGFHTHSDDFTLEAGRFLDAAQGKNHLDWFDPWYWNGATDLKPYVDSSHVLWEGLQAPECPGNPVSQYSLHWPGNPAVQFGDPTVELNRVAAAFVKASAQNAADNARSQVLQPGVAEAYAAEAIATLWRASISALRTNAGYSFDPTTMTDPNQTPVAEVKGKLGNMASETAHSVQARLRIISGNCRLMRADTPEVQTLGDAPRGIASFGDWKVQAPRNSHCRVTLEAIGRYYNTPDLQLAWRNFYIEVPAGPAPPSSDCNCKPGDTMCLTLCHHNPGTPPSSTQSTTPTRKHCTTPSCVEPVDEE